MKSAGTDAYDPKHPTEIFQGYIPRTFQLDLHRALRRFNVIVTHRRFGKSIFAINHLISAALKCPVPNPRFAYLAPTYGMVKRIIWDYAKQYTSMIPGVTYNEADLRIDFPGGARIMLLSAENPNSLRGIYLNGAVLDEMADISPDVWTEVVRATLVDHKGWAIFCSTPKGMNYFYELYQYAKNGKDGVVDPEWYFKTYTASETGIVPENELASLKRQMSDEEYAQEFECSFSAGLVGAYFVKELAKADAEGRIRDIPHDPSIPVDAYFDLGMNDTTAVWFVQSTRFDHRVIDYHEDAGRSIPNIVNDVLKKGYTIDEWVLPHDAEVRDLSTGKSRVQMFHGLGCRGTRIVPRVGDKEDSINAARVILNKCYFDRGRCEKGLKALQNYQKKFDVKLNTFLKAPLHNWASNGADAFQTFALGVRESMGSLDAGRSRFMSSHEELEADTSYDAYA